MGQPTTHLGSMVQPVVPELQACTACYWTKQHEIKSNTREMMQSRECKMCETAAGVTRILFYSEL